MIHLSEKYVSLSAIILKSIRTEALLGAELVIIPTANTSAEPEEIFQWEMRVDAFRNSVNIAMCNRTGIEDKMKFNGRSLVTDYNGNILALADSKEQILFADIDMNGSVKARNNKPYTGLRRTDFYK